MDEATLWSNLGNDFRVDFESALDHANRDTGVPQAVGIWVALTDEHLEALTDYANRQYRTPFTIDRGKPRMWDQKSQITVTASEP